MRLSKSDLQYFSDCGETAEGIEQIKRAKKILKIEDEHGKKLTHENAVKLLGRETFLSGLHRASFHWTSARETQDGKEIFFDCSKLFED